MMIPGPLAVCSANDCPHTFGKEGFSLNSKYEVGSSRRRCCSFPVSVKQNSNGPLWELSSRVDFMSAFMHQQKQLSLVSTNLALFHARGNVYALSIKGSIMRYI